MVLVVVLTNLGMTKRRRREISTDKETLVRVKEEGQVKCEAVDFMVIRLDIGDML